MAAPTEPEIPVSKEKKSVLSRVGLERETHPMVEREEFPEISPEVERAGVVSGQVTLPQPVTDDTGAPVLDDATAQATTVTLPLTEEEVSQALHLKVVESFRWLAEWAKRLLKKTGGKFIYRKKT